MTENPGDTEHLLDLVGRMKDLMELVRLLSVLGQKILAIIELIKKESNRENIEVYIDALQFLRNVGDDAIGSKRKDMREAIRNGYGDLKPIQQKCIEMKVV